MPAPKHPFLKGLEAGREYWRNRTHCKRGHEYVPENVYINPTSGARQCRACLVITAPNRKKMSKEYMANAQLAWRKRNPEKVRQLERAYNLKAFGLTIAAYDEMLLRQGGVCAICKDPPKKMRLAVDHCHKTGVVRGLLCPNCNRGLGLYKDNPNLLIAAASYLMPATSMEAAS